MRKLFILVVCIGMLLTSTISYADTTNRNGWIACFSLTDIINYNKFWEDNNPDAIDHLLKSERCFELKSGVKVTITDSHVSDHTRFVQINGRVWTHKAAINED